MMLVRLETAVPRSRVNLLFVKNHPWFSNLIEWILRILYAKYFSTGLRYLMKKFYNIDIVRLVSDKVLE